MHRSGIQRNVRYIARAIVGNTRSCLPGRLREERARSTAARTTRVQTTRGSRQFHGCSGMYLIAEPPFVPFVLFQYVLAIIHVSTEHRPASGCDIRRTSRKVQVESFRGNACDVAVGTARITCWSHHRLSLSIGLRKHLIVARQNRCSPRTLAEPVADRKDRRNLVVDCVSQAELQDHYSGLTRRHKES